MLLYMDSVFFHKMILLEITGKPGNQQDLLQNSRIGSPAPNRPLHNWEKQQNTYPNGRIGFLKQPISSAKMSTY